jgi:hypothetical protein
MRRITPRLKALLLALALLMSSAASSAGSNAAGRQDGKAKSPKQTTKSRYEELQRSRAEEAAKVKSAIGKIKSKAAELAVEKRKRKVPHTKVTFSFSVADPQGGIAGSVADKATGATILFESKLDGEYLSSRIFNRSGVTLVEYVEVERALVTDPLTGAQSFEPVPAVRFGGVEYQELRGPVVDEMRQLATSPEGALILTLAVYLAEYVPGHDLVAVRRGLEVPYQALQKFYTSPAIEEYGGGDLTAAKQFGAKRREATKDLKPPEKAEPLFTDAADCELFQCAFVDNFDYQFSEQGGYVVKSLSRRLVLSHNFAPPEVRGGEEPHDHTHDDAEAAHRRGRNPVFIKTGGTSVKNFSARPLRAVKPLASMPRRDDGSQVGDCFGHCGGGCGNWSHTWIGEPVLTTHYTYCVGYDPDTPTPMGCGLVWCCSTQKEVVSYSGLAVHTASGKVTLGSKAHDSCVRALGWPAWLSSLPGMPCFPALLLAADCAIPGVGEEHTWSYIGPHSEGYDYYTGVCCDGGVKGGGGSIIF